MNLQLRAVLVTLGLAVAAPTAAADPVILPGGKPGAATSWKLTADSVVLELSESFDAEDVAKAISAKITGATVTPFGNRVRIKGKDPEYVLMQLQSVEVEPLLDEVDAMLSNLRAGEQEEGSGSSIRARKALDVSGVLGKSEGLVHGRVVQVERGRYPFVVVRIEVTKAPAGLSGVTPKKTIDVIPLVRTKRGRIAPKDRASQLNAGAWYAQPGDQVVVRLGQRRKRGWIARAFTREP